MSLTGSTVTNNAARNAGGIRTTFGGLTVRNSIVAGNRATGMYSSASPELQGGSRLTVTNSLVRNNTGTDLTPSGPTPDANGNLIGTEDAPIEPLLGPLQNNGGPTQTHSLRADSPALDRGVNPLNLANDQRGALFVRVSGAQADMGAFEL